MFDIETWFYVELLLLAALAYDVLFGGRRWDGPDEED